MFQDIGIVFKLRKLLKKLDAISLNAYSVNALLVLLTLDNKCSILFMHGWK